MPFMDLSPRKKRWLIIDHAMILAVVILTLMHFERSIDEVTGKANFWEVGGFTILFLILGYWFVYLPTIWSRSKGSSFDSYLMPLFISLMLSYLYLGFRSYFIQPGATGLVLAAQLFALICLACRMG